MELKLTQKQFRRLLDLVYIGNWVLNSTRGEDRIREYDQVESMVFSHCLGQGMACLADGAVSRRADPQPRLCRGRHPRGHHGL